jgi:aromatic amino acid aminotransferase I
MKLHLDQHPSFTPGDEDTLEIKLWIKLAENGVLFGPGWMFSAKGMTENPDSTDSGHFRISFSNAEVRISKSMNAFTEGWIPKFHEFKKAVTIFGRVIREFFEEEDL